MVNQELLDFIKKSKEAGQTDGQIKSALTASGWQSSDIEEAFRTIDIPPQDSTLLYGKPTVQKPKQSPLKVFLLAVILFVIGASTIGYFVLIRKSAVTSTPTNTTQTKATLNLNSIEKLTGFAGTNFAVVEGAIYIATLDEGLIVMNDSGSETFPRLNRGTSNNDIRDLVVDESKTPWIFYGSYEPNNPKGPAIYWYTAFLNNKKWVEYDITQLIDIDNRGKFIVDINNNLFLITGLGIYKFENGKWNVVYSDGKYDERNNYLENVDYVAIDASNNFYLSSFSVVRIFRDGKFVKELIRQKDTNVETPEKIAIAPDGTIWLLLSTLVRPFEVDSKLVYFRDETRHDFEGNNRGQVIDFAVSRRGEMVVAYYKDNKRILSYYDGNTWTDFPQSVFGTPRFDRTDDNLLYIFAGSSIYKVKRL